MKKTISKKTDHGSEQFLLRLPDGMRERLAKVAERQGHTMNAVIVTALARYFEDGDAPSIKDEISELRLRLARLEARLSEADSADAESLGQLQKGVTPR